MGRHRKKKIPLLIPAVAVTGISVIAAGTAALLSASPESPQAVSLLVPVNLPAPDATAGLRTPQPPLATYTIRQGDTLSQIAKTYCNDFRKAGDLARNNHLSGVLTPGKVIILAC
jgi:LysM repeat protein